jgi:hypothetical protein
MKQHDAYGTSVSGQLGRDGRPRWAASETLVDMSLPAPEPVVATLP